MQSRLRLPVLLLAWAFGTALASAAPVTFTGRAKFTATGEPSAVYLQTYSFTPSITAPTTIFVRTTAGGNLVETDTFTLQTNEVVTDYITYGRKVVVGVFLATPPKYNSSAPVGRMRGTFTTTHSGGTTTLKFSYGAGSYYWHFTLTVTSSRLGLAFTSFTNNATRTVSFSGVKN
jgi:hypothetical protein